MKKIHYTGDFFQVPHKLVERYFPKLKKSSAIFLIALLKLENQLGNPFYHSDGQMKQEFGLSKSTCFRARKELKSYGLIDYSVKWNKKAVKFKAVEYFIYPNKKIRELLKVVNNLAQKKDEKIIKNSHKQVNGSEEVEEIFEFYQQKIGRNYEFQLQPKTKKHIQERRKIFSVEKLKQAIENFANHSWRMEHNARFGPDWFFKSDEDIQAFLNLEPVDPGVRKLRQILEKKKKQNKNK